MQRIGGAVHTAFPMSDPSRVGEARRHAAHLAALAELDETQAGRLAVIVNELGNNLLRHATGGELLLSSHAGSRSVEVLSIDRGPGIADVRRCLGDGFSTGGTPGTGLGAVQRMSQEFDIHSTVPDGTIVLARVRDAGARNDDDGMRFHCGGISVPVAGEIVCGDAWAAVLDGERASVILADGLGHGPDAAEASEAAIGVFNDEPFADLGSLLTQAHAVLRSTRGAAVSILRLDIDQATIRSCGAGNVIARIVSGTSDKSVLTQHGTVGVQVRRPEEATAPWPAHALLIVHSDGIEARWNPQLIAPVLGRDPVLVAAVLLRAHSRGRDDSTIVVLRRKE